MWARIQVCTRRWLGALLALTMCPGSATLATPSRGAPTQSAALRSRLTTEQGSVGDAIAILNRCPSWPDLRFVVDRRFQWNAEVRWRDPQRVDELMTDLGQLSRFSTPVLRQAVSRYCSQDTCKPDTVRLLARYVFAVPAGYMPCQGFGGYRPPVDAGEPKWGRAIRVSELWPFTYDSVGNLILSYAAQMSSEVPYDAQAEFEYVAPLGRRDDPAAPGASRVLCASWLDNRRLLVVRESPANSAPLAYEVTRDGTQMRALLSLSRAISAHQYMGAIGAANGMALFRSRDRRGLPAYCLVRSGKLLSTWPLSGLGVRPEWCQKIGMWIDVLPDTPASWLILYNPQNNRVSKRSVGAGVVNEIVGMGHRNVYLADTTRLDSRLGAVSIKTVDVPSLSRANSFTISVPPVFPPAGRIEDLEISADGRQIIWQVRLINKRPDTDTIEWFTTERNRSGLRLLQGPVPAVLVDVDNGDISVGRWSSDGQRVALTVGKQVYVRSVSAAAKFKPVSKPPLRF
jgi:hypothetical protein